MSHWDEVRSYVGFEESLRMGVRGEKLFCQRRRPVPEFVNNTEQFREVLCRMMEQRAFRERAGTIDRSLPREERLRLCVAKIRAQRPSQIEELRRLCVQFQRMRVRDLKSPRYGRGKKLRILRLEIEGRDTYLRTIQRGDGGAGTMAAVLYLYYRTGWNSPAIAKELGIKPPHVRQIIWRANQIAASLTPAE